MPVKRRVDKRRDVEPDHVSECNLDLGWPAGTDDDAMRAAWEQHRDFFMAKERDRAGMRPYAWWVFDSGLEGQPNDQESALHDLGLLDADEEREVRAIYANLPRDRWPEFMCAEHWAVHNIITSC